MQSSIMKAAEVFRLLVLESQQKEAVLSFLEGNDLFVSLPTGGGKSKITKATWVEGQFPLVIVNMSTLRHIHDCYATMDSKQCRQSPRPSPSVCLS